MSSNAIDLEIDPEDSLSFKTASTKNPKAPPMAKGNARGFLFKSILGGLLRALIIAEGAWGILIATP